MLWAVTLLQVVLLSPAYHVLNIVQYIILAMDATIGPRAKDGPVSVEKS